ncbi:MAG: class I SAM-dependent methyltransferase [Planctomycetes bacterium]|nr:class I SAM-dependent methyltransferase [Planctomycetota bacterium]
MLLNRFERLIVNQPLRPLTQRWIEAPPLRRLGAKLRGKQVLEIGCGQGEGQRILRHDFGARCVVGCDLDGRQLRRARRRRFADEQLQWIQADAEALPFASEGFDAVVSFNALHHVPNWDAALMEARRVLRPGGQLLLLETMRGFLEFPPMRRLMEHPREGRFDADQLCHAVQEAGFELRGTRSIPSCFLWLVAELRL